MTLRADRLGAQHRIERPRFGLPGEVLAGIGVTLLAAILRFWNLGYPQRLVFDETYYVKDAWSLSKLGYEGKWLNNSNEIFESGDPSGFLEAPSFVVHPPLGKWIIAAGMNLFGAENAASWRVSTALLGVLSVVILMFVANRLLRSKPWAVLAGLLLAVDGHAIVLSRTGLLDGILAFFVLLAFWFLLIDRDHARAELALRLVRQEFNGGQKPIVLAWRPWLFAAGISLGAATAVKWSGLYVLAAFGLYVVISETILRRRLEQKFWLSKGVLLQGPVSFLVMVPIAAITYLASWTGWIVTSNGWGRAWALEAENKITGFWSWLPDWLVSLAHYHQVAYNFHVNLDSPHNYASSPLTWLFMIRPTSFFYEGIEAGAAGCGGEWACSSAITALGNPIIWWPAAGAVFYLIYRYIRYRESVAGLILLGMVGGYLPWLLYLDRTVFQFYAVVFLPWMILALIYLLRSLLQIAIRQRAAQIRLLTYFALVLLASAFFYPIWTGIWIPYWYWLSHMWLPSWI